MDVWSRQEAQAYPSSLPSIRIQEYPDIETVEVPVRELFTYAPSRFDDLCVQHRRPLKSADKLRHIDVFPILDSCGVGTDNNFAGECLYCNVHCFRTVFLC